MGKAAEAGKVERDLSTPAKKKFWSRVDEVASRAPTIVGNKLKWPESNGHTDQPDSTRGERRSK